MCLLIGVSLQFVKATPNNTHTVLNQFVINIGLPAMALFYIPKLNLGGDLLFPVLMPWLTIGLAIVLFALLGKIFSWSRSLIGCLIMTAGFGNTSFVGIPIIQALYGDEGIKTLMMIDLPGTFVALSTVGILIASLFSRGKTNIKAILKRISSFPPLWAFLVAIVFNLSDLEMPMALDGSFEKLTYTVSPLALVSVGFQLRFEKKSKHWSYLFLGLGYKLILLPAFIFVLYKLLFAKSGMMIDVCVMEAAMAPMITSSIIAASYGLKPRLCNMMVGIGIPLSFLTTAIWYWILNT